MYNFTWNSHVTCKCAKTVKVTTGVMETSIGAFYNNELEQNVSVTDNIVVQACNLQCSAIILVLRFGWTNMMKKDRWRKNTLLVRAYSSELVFNYTDGRIELGLLTVNKLIVN